MQHLSTKMDAEAEEDIVMTGSGKMANRTMEPRTKGATRRKVASAAAIAFLLAGTACQETMPSQPIEQADIRYIKDSRTGLCFATLASYSYGAYHIVSIASVPCEAAEKVGPLGR
jgi:hypothetical protein